MRKPRTTMSRTILSAALVAACAVTTIGPAGATAPGENGRLAFMRTDDAGNWQVWTANPDLSAQEQLTAGDASSGWPTWSPDGERIAFDSDRVDTDRGDDLPRNDIFTMAPDGGSLEQLTSDGSNFDAAWSPDGREIVYGSGNPGDAAQGIYVMDSSDGTLLRRLTDTGSGDLDLAPRFSPDGSRVVFTRVRFGSTPPGQDWRVAGETSALFVVDADGSHLRRLTSWGIRAGDADWSPDGTSIVFETNFTHLGNGPSVYVVRPDGSGLENLTDDHGTTGVGRFAALRFEHSFDPAWSPDGQRIVFGHGRLAAGTFTEGLMTMAPDGSGRAYVSPDVAAEHQADWGTAPLH